MVELQAASMAMAAMFVLGVVAWLISLAKRDVSIVDSFWSLFFLAGVLVYAWYATTLGSRATLLLVLVSLWALRLAGYLTWRNWGEPEDRRYQAIRVRNQPGFEWKSLYLVFGLQALLAAIITAPLLAGMGGSHALNFLDLAGLALWVIGFGFETVGDWQLARFKSRPANRRQVLDRGLWRYTRHPNYFGDAAQWWGFYLIAAATGIGAWTIFSPVIMTFLLVRVSGVGMLEKTLKETKPGYREYMERTSAFVPLPPRRAG